MKNESISETAKYMRSKGFSFTQISTKLSISRHSARHMCIYHKIQHPKKRGPKFKIEKTRRLSIKRQIAKFEIVGEKVNSTKIIKSCGLEVCSSTVQCYLNTNNYIYKKAKLQIVLSKKHKQERVQIITKWIMNNHFWEKTIFSEEKRFTLDGTDNWLSYVDENRPLLRQRVSVTVVA